MFYDNPSCAFRITGVFYVKRAGLKKVATSRKHISLAYRIAGESCFTFAGKHLLAPAGSVTYIPANVDFERSSTDETLFVVHLRGFENIGDSIEIIEHAEAVEPLFRKLLSAWETKNAKTYNRSIQILYSIFEALQSTNVQHPSVVLNVIHPGVKLLQTRYRDPSLRIAELADACFISEVYFRNLFHRHFGQSPQKALAELRFNYACEMLFSGYYTQKEVAMHAGFSDVKYFRTAFKRRYGMTVSEYTKTNAKSDLP